MTTELYKSISPLQRILITIVVMSATLMQVIDTTIVNVALPHMQGALSASPDEITWTLTSYLVASAIFMPLTGYLSDLLGRKLYLFISIAGFTFVSALCGASVTLPELVVFRLLQGVFGAAFSTIITSHHDRYFSAGRAHQSDGNLGNWGDGWSYSWPDTWRLSYRYCFVALDVLRQCARRHFYFALDARHPRHT